MRWCLPFVLALLSACSTSAPPPAIVPTTPVKITQFYSTTPLVRPGEDATVCYGVEGAIAVRIEPPVDELFPAVARCITFHPRGSTYKLIARGKQGGEATQTITIGKAGPAPRLLHLQISATTVRPGDAVQFCFKAVNAQRVTGGPGKFLKGGQAARDCLLDQPKTTTTYRLTVLNAAGEQDTDSVTVQVKP